MWQKSIITLIMVLTLFLIPNTVSGQIPDLQFYSIDEFYGYLTTIPSHPEALVLNVRIAEDSVGISGGGGGPVSGVTVPIYVIGSDTADVDTLQVIAGFSESGVLRPLLFDSQGNLKISGNVAASVDSADFPRLMSINNSLTLAAQINPFTTDLNVDDDVGNGYLLSLDTKLSSFSTENKTNLENLQYTTGQIQIFDTVSADSVSGVVNTDGYSHHTVVITIGTTTSCDIDILTTERDSVTTEAVILETIAVASGSARDIVQEFNSNSNTIYFELKNYSGATTIDMFLRSTRSKEESSGALVTLTGTSSDSLDTLTYHNRLNTTLMQSGSLFHEFFVDPNFREFESYSDIDIGGVWATSGGTVALNMSGDGSQLEVGSSNGAEYVTVGLTGFIVGELVRVSMANIGDTPAQYTFELGYGPGDDTEYTNSMSHADFLTGSFLFEFNIAQEDLNVTFTRTSGSGNFTVSLDSLSVKSRKAAVPVIDHGVIDAITKIDTLSRQFILNLSASPGNVEIGTAGQVGWIWMGLTSASDSVFIDYSVGPNFNFRNKESFTGIGDHWHEVTSPIWRIKIRSSVAVVGDLDADIYLENRK